MSNVPDDEDDEYSIDLDREEQERRRKAEIVVAYLAEVLRFFRVEKVVAAFNGFDDASSIDVPVYHPPLGGDIPFGLASRIGRLWDDLLPSNWEWGSSGTITIDVITGKVKVDITFTREDEWEYIGEDDEME